MFHTEEELKARILGVSADVHLVKAYILMYQMLRDEDEPT